MWQNIRAYQTVTNDPRPHINAELLPVSTQYSFSYNSQIKCFRRHVDMGIFSCFDMALVLKVRPHLSVASCIIQLKLNSRQFFTEVKIPIRVLGYDTVLKSGRWVPNFHRYWCDRRSDYFKVFIKYIHIFMWLSEWGAGPTFETGPGFHLTSLRPWVYICIYCSVLSGSIERSSYCDSNQWYIWRWYLQKCLVCITVQRRRLVVRWAGGCNIIVLGLASRIFFETGSSVLRNDAVSIDTI
jgi:hypothetical protein